MSKVISAVAQYGIHENGQFYPTQSLKDIASDFLASIAENKSCMLIVNEKKVNVNQISKVSL